MCLRRTLTAAVITTLVVVAANALGGALAQSPVHSCARVTGPGDSGVYVNLSNADTPASIRHIKDAIESGQPRILHWDPANADAHRAISLRGIKRVPGMDRDEYPIAASREGGAGADVRLIPSSDNRSSGAQIGAVMRRFCAGQAFIVEP